MNRDVKIALCTLALMTGGCSIMSATSAFAAQAVDQTQIAAPENGVITKEYVQKIVDSGVDVQQILDKYMDQIVKVDQRAFKDCAANLDFSRAINLQEVGHAAFLNSKLSAINLEKVTFIGELAFSCCFSLTNVHFGDSALYEIPSAAFLGCVGLKSVKIPDSVRKIRSSAFGRTGLYSVVLPRNVEFVGDGAFGGCSNMICARIENLAIEFYGGIKKCFNKGQTFLFDSWNSMNKKAETFVLTPEKSDLRFQDVIIFCDNIFLSDDIRPLSEVESFKLLTTENGKYITIDADARREQVAPIVQDHNGTVIIGNGCSHVNVDYLDIGDAKTIVFANGVKRVLGSSLYGNSRYDVVIPDSVDKIDLPEYAKTVYTNNENIIEQIQGQNALYYDIELKPLGGEQYMMLSDDAEIHALWAELAQLRARDSGHLALDEASVLFDDSAFLNSSRAAHDKLAANRELKNKLREEIEKLQNAE